MLIYTNCQFVWFFIVTFHYSSFFLSNFCIFLVREYTWLYSGYIFLLCYGGYSFYSDSACQGRSNPVMLRAFSWLYAQGLLLAGLKSHMCARNKAQVMLYLQLSSLVFNLFSISHLLSPLPLCTLHFCFWNLCICCFVFVFVFVPYPAMFRGYAWLCTPSGAWWTLRDARDWTQVVSKASPFIVLSPFIYCCLRLKRIIPTLLSQ